jgi:parallel beta-helix repeat protein
MGQLGNDKSGWGGDYEGYPSELTPVYAHGGEMGTDYLEGIIAVAASNWHSMALDVNGGVWTFGDNTFGQLGNGDYDHDLNDGIPCFSDTPVHVHDGEQGSDTGYLENIVAVSADECYSMAVEKIDAEDPNCKGRVYTCGYYGCYLGHPGYFWPEPGIVRAGEQDPCDPNNSYLEGIVAVAAGYEHSMALDVNGNVWTWGDNSGGELGIGKNENEVEYSLTPVKVVGLNGEGYLENIVAIDAGKYQCLALDSDGTVWAWGANLFGNLGVGELDEDACTPIPIGVVSNKTQQKFYFKAQDANDDANSGDVLQLSMATLHEDPVLRNKSLTLKGKDPDDPNVVAKTIIYSSDMGVMFQDNTGSVLSGLTFIGGYYAGVFCDSSSIEITKCIFTGIADGIYLEGSNLTLADCIIEDNYYTGVGCYANWGSNMDINIIGCTIKDNGHGSGDYGIDCYGYGGSFNLFVSDCDITGNSSHGIRCAWTNVVVSDCNIVNNGNDGVNSGADDLEISGCLIDRNGGNGIYGYYPTSSLIENNIIRRNGGHGVYCETIGSGIDVTIKNNWIHNNGTSTGDGIRISDSWGVEIRNNTIVDNKDYGIETNSDDYYNISNCILWGNDSGQLNNNCTATYSCIQNWTGSSTYHNINSDPCFANPSDSNDYHIAVDSLCIDAGDSYPNPGYDDEIDIDGDPRVVNIAGKGDGVNDVDIGADEYDPNFISLWKFDEGSGTTASDSIGDNDGTLVNGPDWTAGKIGGALSFDGVDDYVNFDAHIGDYQNLSTGTISIWIKKDSTGSAGGFFCASDGGDVYSSLYFEKLGNEKIKVRISENDTSRLYWVSNDTLPAGWHHFAYVTNSSGQWIYLDGEPMTGTYTVGSASTNAFFDYVTQQDTLRIGHIYRHSEAVSPWDGLIDDVRIYNRALSAEEIELIYETGIY